MSDIAGLLTDYWHIAILGALLVAIAIGFVWRFVGPCDGQASGGLRSYLGQLSSTLNFDSPIHPLHFELENAQSFPSATQRKT